MKKTLGNIIEVHILLQNSCNFIQQLNVITITEYFIVNFNDIFIFNDIYIYQNLNFMPFKAMFNVVTEKLTLI